MNGVSSYHHFLQGETEALEELVRAYSDSLVRFAFFFLHDPAAAEDAAADAFAMLLVKRKRFEEEAQLKAYLYKVTRNRCMDVLRAKKRASSIKQPAPAEDVWKAAEVRERNATVYACMQALPEQYRDALYLTYYEGFSPTELTSVLHRSKKQVYNLLARAKTSLKELLMMEGIHDENV